MWRSLAAAALVALTLAWPAVAAAQNDPFGGPNGAILVSNSFDDSYQFELSCNPDGTSTIHFSVTGSAYGPYFGTFDETGTIVIGPQDIVVADPYTVTTTGYVQSFDAEFTIRSGDTTITGTKHLVHEFPSYGTCKDSSTFSESGCQGTQEAGVSYADFQYDATISGPDGTTREQGLGDAQLTVIQADCGGETRPFGQLEQNFTTVLPGGQIPATLTLSPATAVNPVGTPHTVTATVTDEAGQPVQGVTVVFGTYGAVHAYGECTTDVDGQCAFTFAGPQFPGVVVIEAYVDTNGNRQLDVEPNATATKEFVLPASTPGAATGGGQAGGVTFGFTAKSDANGRKGECTVVAAATNVKCLDVLAYVQTGNTATFYGHATVDGVATLYRVGVVDGGDSGAGRDVFTIQTASGYSAGGVLTQGNVQVH